MNPFQKIAAAIGGIGVLAIAIWLGTIIFILLLIAAPILYLLGRWKMGKMQKEFEAHHARMREQGGMSGQGGTIDAEYVVVDEPLDETRPPKP